MKEIQKNIITDLPILKPRHKSIGNSAFYMKSNFRKKNWTGLYSTRSVATFACKLQRYSNKQEKCKTALYGHLTVSMVTICSLMNFFSLYLGSIISHSYIGCALYHIHTQVLPHKQKPSFCLVLTNLLLLMFFD